MNTPNNIPRPDLDAIEARATAATPGPWQASYAYGIPDYPVMDGAYITAPVGVAVSERQELTNGAFIAAAREDVPALTAYARRLEAALQLATDANAALVAQQPSADNLAQATAAVVMWSKASPLDEAGRACALQLAAALQDGQRYEREADQLRSFVISLYNEANQKPPFVASQSTINRLLKEHRITVHLDTPRVPRAAGLPAGPADPPTPGIERHSGPRRSGSDGVTPSPQNIDGRV